MAEKKLAGGSISGDLGARSVSEMHKAFPKAIKAAGRTGSCAKALKYRAFAVAGGNSK